MTLTPETVGARLARVRSHARAAAIDALVVTHLPNIQYLTGFAGTAGAVIVLPRACLLIVDFRYVEAATQLTASLDGQVTHVTFERSYDEAIVDVLLRDGSQRVGVEAAYLPVARFTVLAAGLAARSPLPVEPAQSAPTLVATERLVERARVVKDDVEIERLREGARRLAGIAGRIPGMVRVGRTERSIAVEIETALLEAGFSRPAFETIVASGPNSVLPHARPTERAIQAGESAVLDFGGVYDGYCVDLTRTVQVGAIPPSLGRLFEAVAEAQEAAIRTVRPGVAASTIDAAARSVLERHGLGEAFGHGTGHGLGLEVHEEPRIARASFINGGRLHDEVVAPGMVFTIEPGAYVPGVGGVRIEDDVLVTDDACEVLTR